MTRTSASHLQFSRTAKRFAAATLRAVSQNSTACNLRAGSLKGARISEDAQARSGRRSSRVVDRLPPAPAVALSLESESLATERRGSVSSRAPIRGSLERR